MPNLNLRGMDSDLIAELKSEAALAKMNLPEYCTVVFENRKSLQKKSIAPLLISMGADLAVGSDLWRGGSDQDGEVVSETFTGLSGTPINMEPFRPKPSVCAVLYQGAANVEIKQAESETVEGGQENPQTAQEGDPVKSQGEKSDALGLARKRRLALDAVAGSGGKVRVASEIPAPEPKSSNCSECGGFNGNHFRGCKKGK